MVVLPLVPVTPHQLHFGSGITVESGGGKLTHRILAVFYLICNIRICFSGMSSHSTAIAPFFNGGYMRDRRSAYRALP